MANRRFEMFEIRHILVRMRQGDSDRALAKAGLIGRPKAKALRLVAKDRDWLDPAAPLAGRCGAGATGGINPWTCSGSAGRLTGCPVPAAG